MDAMGNKIRHLARKSSKGEDGFTLIEVIVAVAILSIIAVGIFSALGTSLASTTGERDRATAKNLAESQLEYIKQKKLDYFDEEFCKNYDEDEDFGTTTEDCDWDDFEYFLTNPPLEYLPDEEIMSEYGGFEVTFDVQTAEQGERDVLLLDEEDELEVDVEEYEFNYLQLITVTVSQGGVEVWELLGEKLITYETYIFPYDN